MKKASICIVTHVDADAVASAALYIACSSVDLDNVRALFVAPRELPKALESVAVSGCSKIVVSDLAPNPSNFGHILGIAKEIISKGIDVEWYDHHVWENEWIRALADVGVKIVVDRSTCAAGVVSKYVCRNVLEDLARVACSVDLWKFDDWRAPYFYRIVEKFSTEGKWFELVRELVEKGLEYVLRDCEGVVEEVVSQELALISRSLKKVEVLNLGDVNVCVYVKDSGERVVSTSLMCNAMIGRGLCDIAVVVRQDLRSVSLRSRRCNVREIAKALGGGGHPRAAGAPFPRGWRRLLAVMARSLGMKDLSRKLASKVIIGKLLELRGLVRDVCE